ncbi:hypothetical protein MMC11_007090 [Xylographa trunciseda]|nr:hypothetical protein [Xylographa trunciseda]
MISVHTLFSMMHLILFTALTLANPLPGPIPAVTTSTYSPSPSNANGTANPFYPCGSTASEITACPYRCYTPTGSLLPQCYTATAARRLSVSYQAICVKCLLPSAPVDYPGGCTPLHTYFAGQDPSPCGFAQHRLPGCAWICGEAQVPFDLCSATNTTGEFSLCSRCVPQCSSPQIALDLKPPGAPQPDLSFSLSNGSCDVGPSVFAHRERVACPWRCTFAGYPAGTQFCSLTNKTDTGGTGLGFTTCTECVQKVQAGAG